MSYRFRDLENAGEGKRKSAILMALIASLDDLRLPDEAESQKFGELFIPLFNSVDADVKRQAASAVSRCPYVPANVAEFIALQPLELSAPFLSHSPSLTNPILCYVIAKTDEAYGKIIAKRHDLNKRTIQSLMALNSDAVMRSLQLRGYVGDASVHAATSLIRKEIEVEHIHQEGVIPGEVEFFDNQEQVVSEAVAKTENTQPRLKVTYAKPEFDPQAREKRLAAEENLRGSLRDLVDGHLTGEEAQERHAANQSTDSNAEPIVLPIHQGELQHRRHVSVMQKHIENNHLEYFITALADAIGASYVLAERIAGDMSGNQMAVTFNAMLIPYEIGVVALNKFFPHVSMMEGTAEGASALLQDLEHGESLNRLLSWVRADQFTRENELPSLDMSEADVDYGKIGASDMPYVKPIADNIDLIPTWTEDEQASSDGGNNSHANDWTKAIAN